MKKKSTNRKDGLWTASYGEIGATLKALQDNGVTPEHLVRLRAEPEFAKRVADFILCGGIGYSKRVRFVRALMDKNFFGIEDWINYYGARFSQEELWQIPEFPWDEDELTSACLFCGKTIKDCHFAFLGLDKLNDDPLTILKFQELHPKTGQPRFISYKNHPSREYLHKTMDFKWYLLHISIVPGSENKTFKEQEAMLPENYEVSSLIAEIAKDLLYFKKTRNYTDPYYAGNRLRRCADLDKYNYNRRICAIEHTKNGVGYYGVSDIDERYSISIAISRKPSIFTPF